MARYGETIEPDMNAHENYKEIADIQHELYPKLKDTFERLHDLSLKYPSTKPESPAAEL